MDTSRTTASNPASAAEFVPTFDSQAALTQVPGVYGITGPDGTVRYVYADSFEDALRQAQAPEPQQQPAVRAEPAVAPLQPTAVQLGAEHPRYIEPWMVKGAAGLGLAGGAVALAPVAVSAVSAVAAALGEFVHYAVEAGLVVAAGFVVFRLVGGGKGDGGGSRVLEITQKIEQTITQTIRIEK